MGRRVVPITMGKKRSADIYAATLIAVYCWLVIAVFIKILPIGALLCLLTIPLAIRTAAGVRRNAENTQALIPFLGMNVVVTLLTPLLLSIGLFIN